MGDAAKTILTETIQTFKERELDEKHQNEISKETKNSDCVQICTMCCLRPKDATFVHGNISHQVCCYVCAKMIFKSRGTCPVCRRKIEKITKNILVWRLFDQRFDYWNLL